MHSSFIVFSIITALKTNPNNVTNIFINFFFNYICSLRRLFSIHFLGPADLLQYVDPFFLLICNEFDLGKVGYGTVIERTAEEEEDYIPLTPEEKQARELQATPRTRLIDIAISLWKLPVHINKMPKLENKQVNTTDSIEATQLKEKQAEHIKNAISFESNVRSLIRLIESFATNEKTTTATSAESGTRAPSMEETVQRDEWYVQKIEKN